MGLSRRIKAVVDVLVVVHLRVCDKAWRYTPASGMKVPMQIMQTLNHVQVYPKGLVPLSVIHHHLFCNITSFLLFASHPAGLWLFCMATIPGLANGEALINIPSRSPSITHSSPSWIPPHANHFPRLEERQWRSNPHLLDRVDGGPAGPWSSVAAFLCFFFRVSFGLCQ